MYVCQCVRVRACPFVCLFVYWGRKIICGARMTLAVKGLMMMIIIIGGEGCVGCSEVVVKSVRTRKSFHLLLIGNVTPSVRDSVTLLRCGYSLTPSPIVTKFVCGWGWMGKYPNFTS